MHIVVALDTEVITCAEGASTCALRTLAPFRLEVAYVALGAVPGLQVARSTRQRVACEAFAVLDSITGCTLITLLGTRGRAILAEAVDTC